MVNLTTKWGLPLFSDTDAFDPIQTPLSLMSTANEAAMNKLFAAGGPSVANQAERDIIFPTATVKQGDRVYRIDLGRTEAYYGVYNLTTNPGGRPMAGWAPSINEILGGSGTLSANATEQTVPGCSLALGVGRWNIAASAYADWTTGGGTPPVWTFRLRQGGPTGAINDEKAIYIAGHAGKVPVALQSAVTITVPDLMILSAIVTGPNSGETIARNCRITATPVA